MSRQPAPSSTPIALLPLGKSDTEIREIIERLERQMELEKGG